jgi:hypothetical protein
MPSTLHAVLTGDIVRSTRSGAPPMSQVRASLEASCATARSAWGCVIGELEVFRGDSWQMLLSAPDRALDVAFLLRAGLRADCDMDTRAAIGIGTVSELDEARISRSTGEAFLASGRLLDDMRAHRLALAPSPATQAHFPWIGVALALADRLIAGWTQRQAELVRLALLTPDATQAQLGALISPPVTQQSVRLVLDAAGWGEAMSALQAFRGTTWRR